MIGTVINALAVIVGGTIGLVFKKAVPERLAKPIMTAEGLAIIIISLNGVLTRVLAVDSSGKISSSKELLILVSLVIGVVAGELIDLDAKINTFARKIETRIGKSGFAEGFVSATLIYCVGAMVIIGPIAEVIDGDITVTAIKSFLDGVTSITLAVTLGYGVLFACIPVLVIQGGVALFARLFVMVPDAFITDVCAVGFCIVLCIGLNFVFNTKIKTANFLPALIVPVLYNLLLLVQNL